MNKSILAIAVAATMAAPAAVMASAPTVYGNVHLSINDFDSAANIDMTSNTSSIGVKGSEDLGDGMKAIYKVEFQVDISDSDTTVDNTPLGNGGANGTNGTGTGGTVGLVNRDMFVGLKGGMGTVKFGTFSSNYKQKGGKVDSLYRTRLEGRGFLHTQSRLHNGRDINRGRMTNAVSYTSPKMGGIQLVVNTTVSGAEDETVGAGLRWANKSIMAYVDWIDAQTGTAQSAAGNNTESAVKVGGGYKSKAFRINAQYEDAEDLTMYNYIHLNGGFNINKNNSIEVTYGMAEHVSTTARDTDSFALAYNHKLSKMTNVYVGYGDKSSDTASLDDNVITAGIKKKF